MTSSTSSQKDGNTASNEEVVAEAAKAGQPIPGHQEFIPSDPSATRGEDNLPTEPDKNADAELMPTTANGRSRPSDGET